MQTIRKLLAKRIFATDLRTFGAFRFHYQLTLTRAIASSASIMICSLYSTSIENGMVFVTDVVRRLDFRQSQIDEKCTKFCAIHVSDAIVLVSKKFL